MSEPTKADRNPVDLLAEEFAQRFRRGDPVSISEYAEKYPQHANELREVLPSVAMMEELKRTRQKQQDASAGMKLERLGDYHILREIGRGGMGIVYEAEQKALGRRVALKVLPRHFLLDPKRLQRFQREAQAAAQLHHTNIVPVFGIGEADGLHYYVMQFVHGQSLSQVLDSQREGPAAKPAPADAPTRAECVIPEYASAAWWRWVANVGVQAAEALDYAHRQGILHRDVKPANILLDTHGIVWIADFGLAKLSEHTDLTAPGDIIGTLQYIAPETLQSQADARSDVCSLGLTLYELLTLRPPFDEPNTARLLRLVSETEPQRPRGIQPRIPRDLETIILKASARHPDHRYANAAQLAEDLRCFIDDRPIQARRAGSVERLWRWCRRNRIVASLMAAVAASLLLALGVGWSGYVRTNEALARESQRRRDADEATAKAEAATQRAEASLAMSTEALEDLFNKIAPADHFLLLGMATPEAQPHPGAGRPGSDRNSQQVESKEKADLLESILKFYDRVSQQNVSQKNITDLKMQKKAAEAYRRIGDIHFRVGKLDDAASAFTRALGTAEKLLKTSPSDDAYIELVAECRVRLGLVLRRKDPKLAEPHFRQAVAETTDFVQRRADAQTLHLVCSFARYSMGDFLYGQNHPAEARVLIESSIAETQKCIIAERTARTAELQGQRPALQHILPAFMGRQLRTLHDVLLALGEKAEASRTLRRIEDLMARKPPRPFDGRPENRPPRDGLPPQDRPLRDGLPQDFRPPRDGPPPPDAPPPPPGI